jgi:Flp pilus assembly CpaF family ATPase
MRTFVLFVADLLICGAELKFKTTTYYYLILV